MATSFTEGKIKIHIVNGEGEVRSFFETLMSSTRERVVALAESPFMREQKHLFNTALAIYDLAVALKEVDHFNENFFEVDFEDEINIRGGNVERFPFDELKAVLEDKNVKHVDFEMFTLHGAPELKVERWTIRDMKVFRGIPVMFNLEEV